jgi:hypothetical protein
MSRTIQPMGCTGLPVLKLAVLTSGIADLQRISGGRAGCVRSDLPIGDIVRYMISSPRPWPPPSRPFHSPGASAKRTNKLRAEAELCRLRLNAAWLGVTACDSSRG